MATTANNTSQDQEALDKSLLAAVYINGSIAVVLILIFLLIRKRLPVVYHTNTKAEKIPTSFVGWIPGLLRRDYFTILNDSGLDIMIIIMVLKNTTAMLLIMLVFGWLITIPVDATASARYLPSYDSRYTSGTAILSVANITNLDRARYWVHQIQIIFNLAVAFYFLWKMYRQYLFYRRQVWKYQESHNYTVRISQMDPRTTRKELKKYMEKFFPGEVIGVNRIADMTKLIKLKEERMKYVRALETARIKEEKKEKRQFTRAAPPFLIGIAPALCCFPKAPALEYYEKQIKIIENKIATLQEEFKEEDSKLAKLTPVSYVTFKHCAVARIIEQCFITKGHTSKAPEPNNIRWKNHHVSKLRKKILYYVVNVITLFLLIFYAIPVAFAASLANLQSLSEYIPFLSPLNDLPTLASIINAILPTIVIALAFFLLKLLLYKLQDLPGPLSHSKLDTRVFQKLILFYVINVYLVSILATSFLGIVNQIFDFITSQTLFDVFILLGRVLPSQAIYFMNYIITRGITGEAIFLLRPVNVIFYVYTRLTVATPREKLEATLPDHWTHHENMAVHFLILLMVLTYSCIAPIALIIGVLYFFLAWFCAAYQTTYITKQHYESNGVFFPVIFNHFIACLVIYQIILIGLFIINMFWEGVAITILCIAATVVFYHYATKDHFLVSKFGYMEDWIDSIEIKKGSAQEFIHPAMLPPNDDLEDIDDLGGKKMLDEKWRELNEDTSVQQTNSTTEIV